MDIDKVRTLLEAALVELVEPPPAPPLLSTPDELDAALSLAAPGAVLTLAPGLMYPDHLTLAQPVTLQSAVPEGRMTAEQPLPVFRGGLTISGDDVMVCGIEVRHSNPLTDIVVVSGARVTLDRVRILGDLIYGAKRGVAANGNGACGILRCYIADCFQASPGNDSQAICAWDMAPGLLIEDCYLSAGSETILIGGSDAVSEARMPADVVIRNNTITANPAWMGLPIGVKTRLEVKAGRRILIEGNLIEQCWKQGQGGYLCSLTVRNQNGRAPWSCIEDVMIRNNDFRSGAAAINVLATDDVHPSGVLRRVTVVGNDFSDLDPTVYMGGSKRMVQLASGPADFSLIANRFAGQHLTSVIYFTGKTQATNLTITDNTWPKTSYGVFGDGATVGKAWEVFVASGILSGNTDVG